MRTFPRVICIRALKFQPTETRRVAFIFISLYFPNIFSSCFFLKCFQHFLPCFSLFTKNFLSSYLNRFNVIFSFFLSIITFDVIAHPHPDDHHQHPNILKPKKLAKSAFHFQSKNFCGKLRKSWENFCSKSVQIINIPVCA